MWRTMAALPLLYCLPKPYLYNLRKLAPFYLNPYSSPPSPIKPSFSRSNSTTPLTTITSPHFLSLSLPSRCNSSGPTDLEPYLACSMPGSRLRVAVLLSGGVDSSVALRLLHAAGHSCTGFYLKIWFQEDFENFWSECPWDEDLKYAKAVCDQMMGTTLALPRLR